MQSTEKIPVYVRVEKGRTICICHAGRRGCGCSCCERDTVTRDKFAKWESTRRKNRYGL